VYLWGIFALFSGKVRQNPQKYPKEIEHFAFFGKTTQKNQQISKISGME